MIRSMHSAASGMEAMQTHIDVIANNLANVNTTGFKKGRAEFQDLLYQAVRNPTVQRGGGVQQGRPVGVEIGMGTRLVATQKIFEPGSMKQTSNPLDLSIEGPGFFRVRLPDNRFGYTRAGEFKVTPQGQVVTSAGHPIEPNIFVPPETISLNINDEGVISSMMPGETDSVEIGRLELSWFTNPAGLTSNGNGVYLESETSGRPILGQPGRAGLGTIAQGMLEGSNVAVVEEMIDLIAAQRAYEINSRVIRTADEMLQEASQLR
jgi:flagellar basal-body rod protein FlgG